MKNSIEICPPKIIFKDIQPNQTYEMTILIKNLSSKASRLRIFQPQTTNFRCDYELKEALASGLALKLLISFETPRQGEFKDILKVFSDSGFEQEIPLYAYSQRSSIIFEPFINLGFLRVGKEKAEYIRFKNEGRTTGKIELKFDKIPDCTIDPNFFTLPPQTEQNVRLIYRPNETGILKGKVEVIVDNVPQEINIEITAVTVDFNRFLLDGEGHFVQKLDFGQTYFGQTQFLSISLVNNTPNPSQWKSRLILANQIKQSVRFQTPFEMASEEISKVVRFEPNKGIIGAYSQEKIQIICSPKISERELIWTKHYTMMKEEKDPLMESFNYLASFEFPEEYEDEAPKLNIFGKKICPTIRLSLLTFNFGECALNDRRDLEVIVINKNKSLAIDFQCDKVSSFAMEPGKGILKPGEERILICSFLPKNLGKLDQEFNFKLLDGQFIIPMKISASSTTIMNTKLHLTRGVESLPKDFESQKHLIEDGSFDVHYKKGRPKKIEILNDEEMIFKSKNKEKFSKYLSECRKNREKTKKFTENLISGNVPTLQNLEMLGSLVQDDNMEEETGLRNNDPPVDNEYLYTSKRLSISPKISNPREKDSLYVQKAIGNYEPLKLAQSIDFHPDPKAPLLKKWPSEAKSHADIRDCNLKLSASDLLKIQCGPKKIEFGPIFIKSTSIRVFSVRNDMRNTIKIELKTDIPQLQGTYQLPQIIPSGEIATFEIVFNSDLLEEFVGTIQYKINDLYEYEFGVQALVEPVRLDRLDGDKVIRFFFGEDTDEMEVIEKLYLKNPGNGSAFYSIDLSENKYFSAEPISSEVLPGQTMEIKLIYRPIGGNYNKIEEEKLIILIRDGNEICIRCSGMAPDSKLVYRDISNVNLGDIQVSERREIFVGLKNAFHHSTAFQIDKSSLPPNLEIYPLRDRIANGDTKTLKLSYSNREEIELKDHIIIINIRGGKIIKLPFSVRTILPFVCIIEDEFDFGEVTTLGRPNELQMNIRNNSPIKVQLLLDLRETKNPDFECLEVQLIDKDDQISTIITQIDQNEEVIDISEKNLEEEAIKRQLKEENNSEHSESEGDQSSIIEDNNRFYRIKIKANQTIGFRLKFSPHDVKQYVFELPIELEGYGRLNSLNRVILGEGTKPTLLLDPQIVDFKRKVIANDKYQAKTTDILIMNTGEKEVKYLIDCSELDIDKVFAIDPSEGIVKPGETITITASFNPLTQHEYEKKALLYIDDQKEKSYLELTFKGIGSYPRILFDRREILMPIVPLDVKSRCIFKIINDGFENLNIKHQIAKEFLDILDINYPEGKNLGVTKNKLKIEVVFQCKKPFSFTTRLEFFDSDSRPYLIPLSATTDNCLFTNFPYFQTVNPTDYLFKINNENGSVCLEDLMEEKVERSTLNSSIQSSKISNSSPSFQKITKSLNSVVKWLNHFVLSTQIQTYPEDVIKSHGAQLFELISFLTGKNLVFKAKMDQPMKRSEKITVLLGQYDQLLHFLMENGALLATVRPYYLLNYSDFTSYIKKKGVSYVPQAMQRLPPAKYSFYSALNWLEVFYQTVKIFYLSRVTIKSFHKQFPNDKLSEGYLESSNVYSSSEMILLKWIEKFTSSPQLDFDRGMIDSLSLASVLQGYITSNSIKSNLNLKPECKFFDDLIYNAEKLLATLGKIGLETHFSAADLAEPSSRENVLFLVQIYESLLNYIPKGEPVSFRCILGDEVIKNIELKNPTNKPINFWVRLEGHSDFTIEADSFRIEPKSNAFFKVKFISRVSNPVNAKITFFNKRESNVNAAAIVFDLKSDVYERKSVEVHNLQSALYQMRQEVITVRNNFINAPHEYADFNITILTEIISKKKEEDNSAKKKKKTQTFSAKKNNPLPSSNKQTEPNQPNLKDFLMPTFICSKDKVRLRKGESVQLAVMFLPLKEEFYRCRVIFNDPEVGELQYEFFGETLPPELVGEIKPNSIFVDTPLHFEYSVSFKNEQLTAAKKFHESRLLSTGQRAKESLIKFKHLTQLPEEQTFKLDLQPSTSYITIPSTITLKDPYKGSRAYGDSSPKSPKGKSSHNSISEANLPSQELLAQNRLQFDFLFKTPATNQNFMLTMKSLDGTDVRFYRICVVASPKIVKGTLKLKCPIGEELKQEIPFANNSDKDWIIRTTLLFDTAKFGSSIFQVQRELSVKKKTVGILCLFFRPNIPLEKVEGRLTILNNNTNEHYEYDLVGTSQDPLARSHITLHCYAQKPEKKNIEIQNPYKDKTVVYLVETDLMNAAGPEKISIEPNKIYKYPLTICPLVGGLYTGSISFYEENDRNKFIWYTISIHTERSKPYNRLEISSEIRKSLICEIELQNPTDEDLLYEVIIEGEALCGEPTFIIPALSNFVYNLQYLPLKVTKTAGSISFVNEKLGEIWYEISLVCTDKKPEKLPLVHSELGKSVIQKVTLENPSFMEVPVRVICSNHHNFSIVKEEIVIPETSEIEVEIKYTPSDLEILEISEIIFETQTIGNWKFNVSGAGVPPRKFEPLSITCAVNSDLTRIITFLNPLKENIIVHFILKNMDKNNAFKLLAPKGKVTISGNTAYQIPYLFEPKEIREYSCEIIVYMNEKIQWIFPIIGISEFVISDLSYSYKTKSRDTLQTELILNLPNISEQFLKQPFNLSINQMPEELINAINRSFKLTAIKHTLNNITDILKFKVFFNPMKPFKANLDMLLSQESGGRWKFKINLEATEPDKDDTIQIFSPLNHTTSISFKLANRYKNYADFQAYFTYDSDPEFSIIPKKGQLEPYGKEGSVFIVSFTPIEYGKGKTGKLIIETDEIYWSFIIEGSFPSYKPPEGFSLIENRLTNQSIMRLKERENKKNFLLENMQQKKWSSATKKKFINELGLEKSTDNSDLVFRVGDISSILIQEGVSLLNNGKKEGYSAKFTEKNEQSTKISQEQSSSYRNRNFKSSIFKSLK